MRRYPADASFQERKFKVLIPVEYSGTKHACKPCHDRQDSREHAVGEMVLEEFIDYGKLQTKMDCNRHPQPISRREKRLVIRMIQTFRAGRAVDHHCFHTKI